MQFTVVKNRDGTISLKSAHNKFLSAKADGSLACSSASIRNRGGEKFVVHRHDDGMISLRSTHQLSEQICYVTVAGQSTCSTGWFGNRNGNNDAIYKAASSGWADAVKRHIDAGADKNHRGNTGATILCHAAYQGHLEVVQLLIDVGADLSAVDDFGKSGLEWATERGHTEVVAVLENAPMPEPSKMVSKTLRCDAKRMTDAEKFEI
jgi:hypothetical protein